MGDRRTQVRELAAAEADYVAEAEAVPEMEAARERLKTGRNQPCPCGSGRKYKKCCLASDETRVREAAQESGSAGGRLGRSAPHPEAAAANVQYAADLALEHLPFDELEEDDAVELENAPPSEALEQAKALWHELRDAGSPPVERMDALVERLLFLPPEKTHWNDVFDLLASRAHPDLPRVFRCIADAVPATKQTGMAFLYWRAAMEFAGGGRPELLAEVATRFRGLDGASYDPDALDDVLDILLAERREDDALNLAEHFLPVMRADDDLMPPDVSSMCDLVFTLRQGRALRRGVAPESRTEWLAGELSRDLEDEINPDAARNAAEVLAGQTRTPAWGRADFALPPLLAEDGDAEDEEWTWRAQLRLNRMLLLVAREGWETEQRPPGCTMHGLFLLRDSLYDELEYRAPAETGKAPNLLDYLRPTGLEGRIARFSREFIGVNHAHARLLLDACDILSEAAQRHLLISTAAAGRTAKKIRRLKRELRRAGHESQEARITGEP